MEVQNVAKKLQEWAPTVANSKKDYEWEDSGAVRMFPDDKKKHVFQVYKNNNSKEDNVKLTIVQ